MLHQFSRLAEIIRRTDVNPCAVDWELVDFATFRDNSVEEIGGVEIFIFRYQRYEIAIEEVDAGIGIIIIGGLLLKSYNTVVSERIIA